MAKALHVLPAPPPVTLAIERSENAKLGLAHATYTAQASCPPSCPLQGAGCYAEHGPMGIHTRALNRAAAGLSVTAIAKAEAEAITERLSGRLDLRLHVVGDSTTDEAAAIVSEAALRVLKPTREAWTYTHAWPAVSRAAWGDVSALASCETPAQAEEAMDEGYAAALIVPKFQEERRYIDQGVKVIPCPNQTRGVTCVNCRLCFNDTRLRKDGIVIGFETHGSRLKTVAALITNMREKNG